VSWKKLVLLGDPRPAIEQAFLAVLGTERNIGRLVLQGDAMEFGIRRSGAEDYLLVVEITIQPYHHETLRIALDRADHVVFAMGLDPREEYLGEVRRLGRTAPCDVVRWDEKPKTVAAELIDAARRASTVLLSEASEAVTRQPTSFPYLPSTFSSCYAGEVWGWGVGGWEEQLRSDVRLPPPRPKK
jgi:hypothetical protein